MDAFTSGALGKLQEFCADILVFQWRVPTDLSQKNLSPALIIRLTKIGKQRQTRRERRPHQLNDLEIIYTTGYTPLFQSAGKFSLPSFFALRMLNIALHGIREMLGNLETSVNSLEQGSKNMLAQAKLLATKQTAKSWMPKF